jgi:dienelactone hydrolase
MFISANCRQLIDTDRHVADIIASANHVVSDARVDETRLFLWGTSLAGGHVIAAAARSADVLCDFKFDFI